MSRKKGRTIAMLILLGISFACLGIKVYRLEFGLVLPPEPRPKTVAQRVQEFGPRVDARLAPFFHAKNVAYPPERLVFVGLKSDKRLEIYASNGGNDPLFFIRDYPILGASGETGPKLREGDLQVPEGIYRIELLNPNSLYHLSLRIGYPNDWDRQQARKEGRTNLGGDIMIHGGTGSVGCLAMGDDAAEDLFILAARTGIENIRVLLCPVDFRKTSMLPQPEAHPLPRWTSALYEELRRNLATLPLPEHAVVVSE